MQNPFEKQAPIPGIKNIIAVASGKGGVGKSTVSANLAMSLKLRGLKVGLLDCDIYGPSVPRIFGLVNQKPPLTNDGKIQPIERYGLKLMSIGFLVDENAAVVWRGPMLFKAIDQFLKDVTWGNLDVLLIDLPPGTGDVQLTLAQRVPITGAITVSTPQNLSLIDVKKSLDMFMRVNVPILGLIENMSYITASNGEKITLYPKGELEGFLDKAKIPKLAELPFYPRIAQAAESGIPLQESLPDSEECEQFYKIASKIAEALK